MEAMDGAFVCSCPPARGQGRGPLVAEGQRVCVTMLRNLELWQENRRVWFVEDATYAGIATNVTSDGLFDLIDANGQRFRFYARDPNVQIELLTDYV